MLSKATRSFIPARDFSVFFAGLVGTRGKIMKKKQS